MEKTNVPDLWFVEYRRELANAAMSATSHIEQLRNRIELFKSGNPCDFDLKNSITLEMLLTFLDNAPSFESEKQKFVDFALKYNPIKELKGDLKSAKQNVKELSNKILKSVSIQDEFDAYSVIGDMQDKYYLSNLQTDKLMEYMNKIGLLY